MDDATLSPGQQQQRRLQREHERWLEWLATRARIERDEAEAKAKARDVRERKEGK
jgi:hypothetical protein